MHIRTANNKIAHLLTWKHIVDKCAFIICRANFIQTHNLARFGTYDYPCAYKHGKKQIVSSKVRKKGS